MIYIHTYNYMSAVTGHGHPLPKTKSFNFQAILPDRNLKYIELKFTRSCLFTFKVFGNRPSIFLMEAS